MLQIRVRSVNRRSDIYLISHISPHVDAKSKLTCLFPEPPSRAEVNAFHRWVTSLLQSFVPSCTRQLHRRHGKKDELKNLFNEVSRRLAELNSEIHQAQHEADYRTYRAVAFCTLRLWLGIHWTSGCRIHCNAVPFTQGSFLREIIPRFDLFRVSWPCSHNPTPRTNGLRVCTM
ncbi:hypothetical protein B0H34DRAFT_14242 [Crassisporium funariophilum]|nr:hypothetical protein B0H34DRAFT_14242 [Crassisporium funariophilum]